MVSKCSLKQASERRSTLPLSQGVLFFFFGLILLGLKAESIDFFSIKIPPDYILVYRIFAGIALLMSLLFMVATFWKPLASKLHGFLEGHPTSTWQRFSIVLFFAVIIVVYIAGWSQGLSGIADAAGQCALNSVFWFGIVWFFVIVFVFLEYPIRQCLKGILNRRLPRKPEDARIESLESPRFPEKGQDVVYGLAKDRWHAQQQQIELLDEKLGNLLGFSCTLAAILAAFLTAFITFGENAVSSVAWVFVALSGVAFIVLTVCSLFVYRTRGWESGPELDEAWQYACYYEEKKLTWWVAESLTNCYKSNKGKVKMKARMVNGDIILIWLQTVFLVASFAFIALS